MRSSRGTGTRGRFAPLSVAAAAAGALALVAVGCGDEPPERPPQGPLADALADVGGGGADGSLGVGWAEPRLVRQRGGDAALVADAVGPNARTVIEAAPVLRRRFRFDPLEAERLISIGGSYAFGLRLDGVGGGRLESALTRRGARVRRAGRLELADVGDYAVVPEPLLRAGVLGLGARDAFGDAVTVLAISDTARASLLGRGNRLLDEPVYRAAADCLGDVVVARMVPDKLLLSTELGVSLVAMGVDGRREVLCVIGGTAEGADEIAGALESSLAPDAREPRTGEPISDLVRAVDVEAGRFEEIELVRVELSLAERQPPGFLFDAVARGSLAELIVGG